MRQTLTALALMAALGVAPATAEEVKTTLGGLTLNADLETADGWPRGPVVLLTHGTLAHRDMEIMEALQSALADRGVSTLAINLSLGLDDRAAAMYDCPTPHTHRHGDAVAEIGAWVTWLRGEGVESLALLGHSRGGNQVARYAAGSPDPVVRQVLLVAPQTWEEDAPAADFAKRNPGPLAPVLAEAQALVAAGKGDQLMGPMGFIYCDDTRASAAAVASYYGADPDMDTPRLIPRIEAPVTVFAGSADTVVTGLVGKVEPLADGERVVLEVLDGADHFFRDLFAEDIADLVVERVAP